ncbi:MAG: tRNA lysidine(34) synthetase TilS [Erysipelotrichaceae bacterium]
MDKFKELNYSRWVIGVSGGADSMALLDMCYEHGVDMIVAHVNYGKRDTSDRDMNGVIDYCKERNIKCYVKYSPECESGNFQAFARMVRYDYFRELSIYFRCAGVLVAHQLDDVLETYLMQRKRQSTPEFYGVKEEIFISDVLVKRILLGYTKKDLLNYCHQHHIVYYDDESNDSDDYERNRIRHAIVEMLSLEDKHRLIKEIEDVNNQKKVENIMVNKIYREWRNEEFSLKKFRGFPTQYKTLILRHWFKDHGVKAELSAKALNNISDMMDTVNHNWRYQLKNKVMVKNYDSILLEENEEISYTYTIEAITLMKTPYFEIQDHGDKIQSIYVQEKDFPLTIRNAESKDSIQLRFGTKRINRWFIDRKKSYEERKIWPVVVNAEGKVIFVAEIGCDIEHFSNNPNMFVIK